MHAYVDIVMKMDRKVITAGDSPFALLFATSGLFWVPSLCIKSQYHMPNSTKHESNLMILMRWY